MLDERRVLFRVGGEPAGDRLPGDAHPFLVELPFDSGDADPDEAGFADDLAHPAAGRVDTELRVFDASDNPLEVAVRGTSRRKGRRARRWHAPPLIHEDRGAVPAGRVCLAERGGRGRVGFGTEPAGLSRDLFDALLDEPVELPRRPGDMTGRYEPCPRVL